MDARELDKFLDNFEAEAANSFAQRLQNNPADGRTKDVASKCFCAGALWALGKLVKGSFREASGRN